MKGPDAGSFLFTLMGLKTCIVNCQNILRTELSTLENVGVGKGIHGIKSIYADAKHCIYITSRQWNISIPLDSHQGPALQGKGVPRVPP